MLQSTGCAKSWTRLSHCTEWSPALPALSVGGPWSQHAPPLTAVLTLGSPKTEVGPRWLGGGGERGLFPVLRGAPFSPPPTSPPVLCSQHPCFRGPPPTPRHFGKLACPLLAPIRWPPVLLTWQPLYLPLHLTYCGKGWPLPPSSLPRFLPCREQVQRRRRVFVLVIPSAAGPPWSSDSAAVFC